MALIPEDIIAQVIDRSDIAEIIGGYIPLKRAGKNFKANCPFHNEKTPSFMINVEKQIFHCFGCGVGGNVVSFVMKHERLEFPEAVRLLAQKVNVEIPEDKNSQKHPLEGIRHQVFEINQLVAEFYHKNLLFGKDASVKTAREYLKSRGVSLDVVKQFQLGYALEEWDALIDYLKSKGVSLGLMEKAGVIIARENKEGYYDRFRHRVMFPIFDTRGQCRAFGARALEASTAKYINSPETPVYTKGHHLYGFHLAKQAILDQDCAVIVEGYMDCLTPHQFGMRHVIASLGTALTLEQVRLLRRYTKNIVFLYDMDAAGQAAMMRCLDMLVEEGLSVKVAQLSEGDDPDSFIRKNGVDAFQNYLNEALPLFDYKLGVLSKQFDVKTLEGKAKISFEMLTTISRVENAVVKSGLINRFAKILGVQEEALVIELKKIEQGKEKRPDSFRLKQESPEPKLQRAVEVNVLKLILDESHLIPITKQSVDIDDFEDHRVRGVIEKIFSLFEEGKGVDVTALINAFEDEAVHQMLSRLAADEDMIIGDRQRIFEDCIRKLKGDRLKKQRQVLLNQIREAEMAGDADALNALKEKFNQSIKR
jgi:DNA primase